ncbi:hypothetical protein CSUI_001425 [Cystoisospora suis]|uniref:Uncharacterized protein n=1 Tax=Cystoisospora suis TaxID=483139 RepID=A0A2C6LD12_9APIC|nr:hypothetical protein CSUI_001425 [Cystoisospora suis]
MASHGSLKQKLSWALLSAKPCQRRKPSAPTHSGLHSRWRSSALATSECAEGCLRHPDFILDLVENLLSRATHLSCLNKTGSSIVQDLLQAATYRDLEAGPFATSCRSVESDQSLEQSSDTFEGDTTPGQAFEQLDSPAKGSASPSSRRMIADTGFRGNHISAVPEERILIGVERLLAGLQQVLDQQRLITLEARAVFEDYVGFMRERQSFSVPQKKREHSQEDRSRAGNCCSELPGDSSVRVPCLPASKDNCSQSVPTLTQSCHITDRPSLDSQLRLLKLCHTLVESMEKDARFKQEVKEELRHFARVGVFRAAVVAWLADPFLSQQQVLARDLQALSSRGY